MRGIERIGRPMSDGSAPDRRAERGGDVKSTRRRASSRATWPMIRWCSGSAGTRALDGGVRGTERHAVATSTPTGSLTPASCSFGGPISVAWSSSPTTPAPRVASSTRRRGAVLFTWLDLHRQVRVRGRVERVGEAESDDYFASRPRAIRSSAPGRHRSARSSEPRRSGALVIACDEEFADRDVPRPPHWGGWRLGPSSGSSGRAARAASTIVSAIDVPTAPGPSPASPPDRGANRRANWLPHRPDRR